MTLTVYFCQQNSSQKANSYKITGAYVICKYAHTVSQFRTNITVVLSLRFGVFLFGRGLG